MRYINRLFTYLLTYSNQYLQHRSRHLYTGVSFPRLSLCSLPLPSFRSFHPPFLNPARESGGALQAKSGLQTIFNEFSA